MDGFRQTFNLSSSLDNEDGNYSTESCSSDDDEETSALLVRWHKIPRIPQYGTTMGCMALKQEVISTGSVEAMHAHHDCIMNFCL